MDDKVCLDLIDVCYGAIQRPSEWQRFVNLLTGALRADAGDFVVEDYSRSVAEPLGSIGFDPTLRITYDADFLGQNPWLTQLRKLPRLRAFSNDLEPADFERSTYFNEWVRPQGFRHALGGFVEETHTRAFHLGVLRSAKLARFSTQEVRAINRVFPHVRRAIGLSDVIGDVSAYESPLAHLIENLRSAAFLVDAAGKICQMNARAEELLHKPHGVSAVNRLLIASDPDAEKCLSQAIKCACHIELLVTSNGRTEVILPSPNAARPPLLAAIVPLRGYAFVTDSEPCCLVLITDPSQTGDDTPKILERIWRLTPTEVRLALALAQGETTTGFAENASISVGTARWHLKNLQSKVGVNSLSALVGLVKAIALRH